MKSTKAEQSKLVCRLPTPKPKQKGRERESKIERVIQQMAL